MIANSRLTKIFGEIVKKHRIKKSLTQRALSEKMGFTSRVTIANIEGGTQSTTLENSFKLASILEFSLIEVEKELSKTDVRALLEQAPPEVRKNLMAALEKI